MTIKIRDQKNEKTPIYAGVQSKNCVRDFTEKNAVSEIASREEISNKQLYNWKKEFLENASKVFSTDKIAKEAKREAAAQEEKEALEKKVGQLTLEVDWLKKSSQLLGPAWEKSMVTKNEPLPVKRQCELLGINRSSVYYTHTKRSSESIGKEGHLKRRIAG
ncbi:MAG: transposase [Clostridiales bacterium]|jgi:putative transposase|nr:transposase [Clostridiales bacterium]